MSETDLSRAINNALQARGCRVERIIPGVHAGRKGGYMHGASPGTPDRVVLCPGGATHWIEVKLPGRGRKPSQVKWHAQVKALGHNVHVVTSVEEALSAIAKGES